MTLQELMKLLISWKSMDNQSILRELTRKGFNFDASDLQARSLAIEKYRQYTSTVEHYLLDAGIRELEPHGESIREIVLDAALEYIRHYARLLHVAWADRSRPIDTVQVNLNDMLGYGEVVAGDLHDRITALLDSEAFSSTGSLVDATYREKIARGYAVAKDEAESV